MFCVNWFSQRVLEKLIQVKVTPYVTSNDLPLMTNKSKHLHKQSDNILNFKCHWFCLLVRYKGTVNLHPIFSISNLSRLFTNVGISRQTS